MKNLPGLRQRKWKPVSFALFLLLASVITQAQVRISGKAKDTDGKGLPSVSVTIKNTTLGASTDAEGNYTITGDLKPGSYTVSFSAVGYKSKDVALTVGSSSSYTADADLVVDALSMDEVVVTGTSQGTTRRQLGSYISTVRADQLTKGSTGNVLAALQGKTPGAQISQNTGDPAGGMSVRLRGVSTINSSSEPLYIIDGVIVSNSARRVTNTQAAYDGNLIAPGANRMADINPNDIERIEVLNGAAAAAIYGSRANAGVVQIFTKRGSSGVPIVNFSTSINLNQLRKDPGYNTAPIKFGGPTDGPGAVTQDLLTPTLTNTTPVTRYNYWDYIFQDGIGTDNNISVRGGKDKTKYYVSGSYLKNQGIIKNTDFQRFSFRMNLDQEVNSWLSFGAGLSFTNSKANEKPDGNSFFSPINSITIIGNFHNIYARDANGNLQAVGERGRINPVSIIEDFKQQNVTNRVISSFNVKLKPVKDLSIDYTIGVDNISQLGTTYIPPYTYNASPDFWGGGISLDPTQNGYASNGNNQQFLINHELNATYNKNITTDLISTTQLGYSLQYEKSNFTIAQGRGLAPFIETVNGASTQMPGIDERTEISISGTYLQQNFKFRNRYFLTAAARLDGSSVFSKDERNQLYFKLSGSYILSDEDFWQNSGVAGWWNGVKLRAAYGESGNLTGIGAYARDNYYSSSPLVGRTALLGSGQLSSSSLRPEAQHEIEVGTDMSFLKGRANLTFNWYNKKVLDLLFPRVSAPSSGYSSVLDNVGTVRNKGIEVMVNATPVKSGNFTWDMDAIFNKNKNRVEEIPQALIQYNNPAGAVFFLPGYAPGIFYGFFFAKNANGNDLKTAAGIPLQEMGIQNSPSTYTPQRDGAGLPSGTPLRKVIGDPTPEWTGTLTNTFTLNKLSLRVQLDAVQGNDVFNADFRTRQGVGNGKEYAEKEDLGLLPRGYVAGVYGIEEWRISDGSFVKLREVSLSYSVGKVKKIFNDLTIALSGRNLISWDNYNGFDPETNAGGNSTITRGIDFGNVPIPRTFALSLNAKF